MKFRVTNKVSCFGVGTTVYYPGDIVEGPEEWKTNTFLEPIPEPAKPAEPPPATAENTSKPGPEESLPITKRKPR